MRRQPRPGWGGTSTFFGTSQAAPAAAACAAALLQSTPGLNASQIETLLKSSATLVTDGTNGLSFPRVDCQQALNLTGLLCAAAPRAGCHPAGKGVLVIKNKANDKRDRVIARWLKATTTLAQFGDPVSGGVGYRMCLYDSALGLVMEQSVAPGGTEARALERIR